MPQRDEGEQRAKDFQYSSNTRFNSTQLHAREELSSAMRRLLVKLPPGLRHDPAVGRPAQACRPRETSLVHLINRHDTRSVSVKDYEFSRATMEQLWSAGRDDARRSPHHARWCRATAHHEGIRVLELTR